MLEFHHPVGRWQRGVDDQPHGAAQAMGGGSEIGSGCAIIGDLAQAILETGEGRADVVVSRCFARKSGARHVAVELTEAPALLVRISGEELFHSPDGTHFREFGQIVDQVPRGFAGFAQKMNRTQRHR